MSTLVQLKNFHMPEHVNHHNVIVTIYKADGEFAEHIDKTFHVELRNGELNTIDWKCNNFYDYQIIDAKKGIAKVMMCRAKPHTRIPNMLKEDIWTFISNNIGIVTSRLLEGGEGTAEGIFILEPA